MASTRFAAIDIGTVTSRLLVAEVDEAGGMHGLFREMAITNLGEGIDATHRLSHAAIARVAQQANVFMNDVARFEGPDGPVRVTAVATSAARDASNSDELVAALARVGVDLHVISGEHEASLSFSGASSGFPGERVVVADVGGGSTELIAGDAGREPAFAHSFDVGCRRVTERFLKADPPDPHEVRQAEQWFSPQFARFFERLADNRFTPSRMVAVAGTATTVVSVDQAMEPYDPARVDGTVVSAATLEAVLRRLVRMDEASRAKVKGLQPGRAPVIVAGLLELRALLETSGMTSFTVSEHDLLQGAVMEAWRSSKA